MANNLSQIMPRILAQALEVLRETAIMPSVVNSDYGNDAKKKGATVDIPITSTMEATDVQPGPYSTNTQDIEPTFVQVPLNNWKESAFALTDKDIYEVESGIQNKQIEEAAKAIANAIDASILAQYVNIANYVGSAGVTPFAPAEGTVRVQQARAILNRAGTPMRDRNIVLDVDAEANAVGLPAFQKANESGSDETIKEGRIGRKVGFDWYYDQLNPYHMAGSIMPKSAGPLVQGLTSAGSTVLVVDGLTSGTAKKGDLLTIAGHIQSYVVVTDATVAAGAVSLSIFPALVEPALDNAAVSFVDSHSTNLIFHRDTFALAVRPLAQENFENELGGKVMSMVDPVTQLPLRLEVRREHKRVRWSLDALWGVGTPRANTGVRLLG